MNNIFTDKQFDEAIRECGYEPKSLTQGNVSSSYRYKNDEGVEIRVIEKHPTGEFLLTNKYDTVLLRAADIIEFCFGLFEELYEDNGEEKVR